MIINLKRQVGAVRHRVLATVDVELNREDIRQLLNQINNDVGRVPPRAIDFLQKEGLIGEDRQLTSKGQATHKTGMLYTRERGIFDIWYLDNDEYLGTRPLVLQRVQEPTKGGYRKRASFYDWPEQINESIESKLHREDKFLGSLYPNVDETNLKSLKIEARNGGLKPKKATLNLTLSAKMTKNGQCEMNFRLSGALAIDNNDQKNQAEITRGWPVEPEEDFLGEIASFLELQWCPKSRRMKGCVPTEAGSLLDFLKPSVNLGSSAKPLATSYGKFDEGDVRRIPLMPENQSIAREWQKASLAEWLGEKYHSPDEVLYRQQVWLQHPAVKVYALHALTGDTLLSALNRSKHPQSYWHAAASHALIPENSRLVPASVTLKDGNHLDAGELLRQLTCGEQVETVIYSDRHYKSDLHATNMNKLAKLGGVLDGIIFSEGESPRKPEGWQLGKITTSTTRKGKPGAQKSRLDHDRYWILITGKEPLIWKCSTSLDFIDFRKPEPRVKGTPTFTRLETHELPEYLQQELNKQTKANKDYAELTQ